MIKKWINCDSLKDKIKVSGGIILILNKSKILLVHPTKAKWHESYSVPKGGVNDGETEIDAAIRELKEETSLIISKSMIDNPNDPIIIEYKNKSGKKYKKLVLYKVYINSISEIGMYSEVLTKNKLQLKEVDWCGFLDKKEAQIRIFHRMISLIDLIN